MKGSTDMHRAMIISRVLVAGVAVWRLSTLFLENRSYNGRSRFFSPRPENIFANRFLDCICWLSVWLSAQTAIWVAGGLAGLLLNWLLISSFARLFVRTDVRSDDTTPGASHGLEAVPDRRPDTATPNLSFLAIEGSMQANHG